MNISPLILHIPHASTKIPSYEGYCDIALLQHEIDLLTDWYTDLLFDCPNTVPVVAPFSRVFCDVERFRNDADEPMALKGMSLTYTHTDSGQLLRTVSTSLRETIASNYYDVHHQVLTKQVDEHIDKYGMARIIDCHSYPSKPLMRDHDQTQPRPDFNIGINSFHTPDAWIESSKKFFSERGYTLGVDWPYAGTLVPMKHYQKDSRVKSMMLEINRDLYLEPGSIHRSANFDHIRKLVGEWLEYLQKK
jgi:N-formylglutamate amidohydrolase